MESITKWLAICFSIVCICIAVYVGWQCISSSCLNEQEIIISCASCLMAVANALLLYATLMSQSKMNKQERFEVTLFSLLDNHRRLLNSIKFQFHIKDVYMNDIPEEVKDNNLFDFAFREFYLIKQVFKEAKYPNINDEYVQNEMEVIGFLKDQDKDSVIDAIGREKALSRQYSLSQRCVIYGISKENWEKPYNGECHLNEIAYGLFVNKWKHEYTPYFRSMLLMFNHIRNSSFKLKDKIRYRNYIIHQMPDHELMLVTRHYLYYAYLFSDSKFKDALDAISKDKNFVSDKSRFHEEDSCKS